MQRGLLRLSIAPDLPALVHRQPGGVVLAPLGRWLMERVASQVPDWPQVGFHRLEVTAYGIELLLVAGDRLVAEPVFAAVLEAIRSDTDRAARRAGWGTDRLWLDATMTLEGSRRERAARPKLLRPHPEQQHDRQRQEDAVHRPGGEVV